MTNSLDDYIEVYLNGNLSEDDTKRFEEDLLEEDVAEEFRELLFLRELLRDIPPDDPPPGLIERIEKSLVLQKGKQIDEAEYGGSSGFGRMIDAFKISLSWPKYALKGISRSTGIMRESLSGINAVSYSLGPLREPARKGIRSIRIPQRTLWKVALSKLW